MPKIIRIGSLNDNGYRMVNEVLNTEGLCRTLISQSNNTVPMILVKNER